MTQYLHERGYCKPRKHVTSVARFNNLTPEQKSAEGKRMIQFRWGTKIDAVHYQGAELTRIHQRTIQAACNRRAKVDLSTNDPEKVTCDDCKAILAAKANGTYIEVQHIPRAPKTAAPVTTNAAVAVAEDEEPF
jgi:hypothetical protein